MHATFKETGEQIHTRFVRHTEIIDSMAVDDVAVTKTGYVVQLKEDGVWRVHSSGVQQVGGFHEGVLTEPAEVFAKLGGFVRRGDALPDCPIKKVVEVTEATEDQFIAGQAVSFMALDGTKAVAQYTKANSRCPVGSLEAWGRKHHPGVVYGEERAREYFNTLTLVFAR